MSKKSNRDIFDKTEESKPKDDVFASDEVVENNKSETKKPEVKVAEPTLPAKKNPDRLRKIKSTNRPTVYL